jgi:hypothetical protein
VQAGDGGLTRGWRNGGHPRSGGDRGTFA